MKAIMIVFDSLNRHLLPPYGCVRVLCIGRAGRSSPSMIHFLRSSTPTARAPTS